MTVMLQILMTVNCGVHVYKAYNYNMYVYNCV